MHQSLVKYVQEKHPRGRHKELLHRQAAATQRHHPYLNKQKAQPRLLSAIIHPNARGPINASMANADRLEVRESAAHTRPNVPVLTNALTASVAHLGRVVNVAPIRQSARGQTNVSMVNAGRPDLPESVVPIRQSALAQTSVSMANADRLEVQESVALTHQNAWARVSAYKENVNVLAREPVEVRTWVQLRFRESNCRRSQYGVGPSQNLLGLLQFFVKWKSF